MNRTSVEEEAKRFYEARQSAKKKSERAIDRPVQAHSTASTMQLNYFMIRELYHCITQERKIKNAMNRFYTYLGIKSNSYDKLVQDGLYAPKSVNAKLVECGFSDTLFRKQTPTRIKLSELLEDLANEYLSQKSVSLKEFRETLKLHLINVRNPDNGYAVIAIDMLIHKIYSDSEPEDTMEDFLEILSEYDFPSHHLQKDFPKTVIEFYKKYKEMIDNHE